LQWEQVGERSELSVRKKRGLALTAVRRGDKDYAEVTESTDFVEVRRAQALSVPGVSGYGD